MSEHGASREKTIEEIKKICDDAWKDMNKEYMEASGVSKILLKYYLNLARTVEFFNESRSITSPMHQSWNSILHHCSWSNYLWIELNS